MILPFFTLFDLVLCLIDLVEMDHESSGLMATLEVVLLYTVSTCRRATSNF